MDARGCLVAEHGALDLARVDALLDQRALVVPQRDRDRGREVLAARFTFVTPTDEPPLDGLTKTGSGSAAASARLVGAAHGRPRAASGVPASRRSALKTALSIPTAEAVTPAPTYGTPSVSRKPWSAPSSPVVPWMIGKTTSMRPGAISAGTSASPRPAPPRRGTARAPTPVASSFADSSGARNRPSSPTAIGTTS